MNNIEQTMAALAAHLKAKNLLLATAESCTGGLIAAALTEISGASHWFERGFVTYSNLSKHQMLGVNPQVIQEVGAVSEAVARAMANGALKYGNATVALAVTGIAGPDGGTKEKPVGTVCFAWAGKGLITQSTTQYYLGNRQAIRTLATEKALQGLFAFLQ